MYDFFVASCKMLLIGVFVLTTACDVHGCHLVLRPAVSVKLHVAEGEFPSEVVLTYRKDDGEEKIIECTRSESQSCEEFSFFDDDGAYEIQIDAFGFLPAEISTTIESDGCHPITKTMDVDLIKNN